MAQIQGQHALRRDVGTHSDNGPSHLRERFHWTRSAGEDSRRLCAQALGIPSGESFYNFMFI